MKIVKSLTGALLVSAWLLTHALFMVNTETTLQKGKNGTKNIQELIPIRLPSVFQLSWFHRLVRQIFNCNQLAMPVGVCGDNCILYLSWIVSALTLAEWAAFTVLLLRSLWNKLICPVISTIGFVLLAVSLYGCIRSFAFMLAPHLPHDTAVAVVRVLVSVDSVLLRIWGSVGGVATWALWALDGVLSSLVWPSFEDIKDDAIHPSHRSLLTEVLKKVQQVATNLPEAAHMEF